MRAEKVVNINEKPSPSVITVIMSVFITMLLSNGFIFMYGTAINLEFKLLPALIFTFIATVVPAVIHSINNKHLSAGAFISAPVTFALILFFDWFNVRKGLMTFLCYLKLYAFYWMPGNYYEPDNDNETLFALLAFFAAYNLIAACVSTYVLIKRRWIPASLLCYLPLFICSVTNIVMRPAQFPTLIAASGVFMVLLSHAFQNKKPQTAEKALMMLTVPVLGITLLTAAVFPESRYGQDKLAKDFLESIQERVDETSGKNDPLSRLLDIVRNGFGNPGITESKYDVFSPLFETRTNLSKVGPFDPPQDRILTVYRKSNPGYDGSSPQYTGHTMYLKVESMDRYENNTLSSTSIRSRIYDKKYDIEPENAQYSLTITPLENSGVDIVPFYTDFYTMDGIQSVNVNPYNSTREFTSEFAASSLPVRTGNIYTEWYLNEYVYKTALRVPKATENALTMSGKLPDWYMEVYMGHIEMSDADKVRGVTEFVSNLHPYNENTEVPPEDVDFVPWFVSDAESGICVHYAVTTVILLRMIGVPARYVRGYVDTRSYDNAESVIFASQAHAWFEFFVPEYGWIMGDSTPGYAADAANFNIDAVSRVSPEIETSAFSARNYTYKPPETTETSGDTSESTSPSDPGSPSESTPTPVPTGPEDPGQNDPSRPDDPGSTVFSSDNYHQAEQKRELTKFEKGLIKLMTAVLIAAVTIWLLLMLAKLIFAVYWRNKFNTEKINEKAAAYYHYYCFMGRLFRFTVPARSTFIAEKAAFSENGITPKELNMLLKDCKEHMKACSAGFSRFKLFFYRLLEIKIRDHK